MFLLFTVQKSSYICLEEGNWIQTPTFFSGTPSFSCLWNAMKSKDESLQLSFYCLQCYMLLMSMFLLLITYQWDLLKHKTKGMELAFSPLRPVSATKKSAYAFCSAWRNKILHKINVTSLQQNSFPSESRVLKHFFEFRKDARLLLLNTAVFLW